MQFRNKLQQSSSANMIFVAKKKIMLAENHVMPKKSYAMENHVRRGIAVPRYHTLHSQFQ